jgi:hypothetical protein
MVPRGTTTNEKMTLYLDPELMTRLDRAQLALRAIPGVRRGEITKSAIIGAALELALQSLEKEGEASPLAGKLLSS